VALQRPPWIGQSVVSAHISTIDLLFAVESLLVVAGARTMPGKMSSSLIPVTGR
jgi:hypothetical protein